MRFSALASCLLATVSAWAVNVSDYPDLQAALDAHPGQVLPLPAGDYPISRKLVLRGDGAGLSGPGRIIQSNPEEPILEIEGLKDVLLRDVTLTRAPGKTVARKSGLLAIRCAYLRVDQVRILDNQSATGALALRECRFARITGCLIRNYMRVSVDDRTRAWNGVTLSIAPTARASRSPPAKGRSSKGTRWSRMCSGRPRR